MKWHEVEMVVTVAVVYALSLFRMKESCCNFYSTEIARGEGAWVGDGCGCRERRERGDASLLSSSYWHNMFWGNWCQSQNLKREHKRYRRGIVERIKFKVFCWATKIFLFGDKPTKRETERGCLFKFILFYFINKCLFKKQ